MRRIGPLQTSLRRQPEANSSCPGQMQQFMPMSEILLQFNPDGTISQRLISTQDFPVSPTRPADRLGGRDPQSTQDDRDDERLDKLRTLRAKRRMVRQMALERGGQNSMPHHMPAMSRQEQLRDQSLHWQQSFNPNNQPGTPPPSYSIAEGRYFTPPPTYHIGMRAGMLNSFQSTPAVYPRSIVQASLNPSGPRNLFSPGDRNDLRTLQELYALCTRRQLDIEARAASQRLSSHLDSPPQSNCMGQDNSFVDIINLPDNTINRSFDVVIEGLERIVQSWDRSLEAGNQEDPTDPAELSRVLAERLLNKSQHLEYLKKEMESILTNLKRIVPADSSFNTSKLNDLLATMQDESETLSKCAQCCSCGAPIKNTPESESTSGVDE